MADEEVEVEVEVEVVVLIGRSFRFQPKMMPKWVLSLTPGAILPVYDSEEMQMLHSRNTARCARSGPIEGHDRRADAEVTIDVHKRPY
jgi:hypothetical protein